MGELQTFGATVPQWLQTVGRDIRSLSLRQVQSVHNALPQLLLRCPELRHLDLEGCRLYDAALLWHLLQNGAVPHLVSLNLTGNMIGAQGLATFQALNTARPDLQLRRVALGQNHIGASGLVHLGAVLSTNLTLETIELDTADNEATADVAYGVQRRYLHEHHQHEVLRVELPALRSRLALLSVACKFPVVQTMDHHLHRAIFEFASMVITRQLVWKE
ncbi:hypothetical protein PINS_up009295 [Pythium insidiosum]|nr:hypothetical protein PINS_up009295 [Pythium insidiosum]